MFTMKINAQEATTIAQSHRSKQLYNLMNHISDMIVNAAMEGNYKVVVSLDTPKCWCADRQIMINQIKKILEANGFNKVCIEAEHNKMNFVSVYWPPEEE